VGLDAVASDSTGAFVSAVHMPVGLVVTQTGPDWVVGIWKDENGVGYARLHHILKAAQSPKSVSE
jgi:hypothetical protein